MKKININTKNIIYNQFKINMCFNPQGCEILPDIFSNHNNPFPSSQFLESINFKKTDVSGKCTIF